MKAKSIERQNAFHEEINPPGTLEYSVSDHFPFQVEVIVVGANDLKIMDKFSSDPYVMLMLERSRKRLGRTDTIRRNLNPCWDSSMNNKFCFSLVSIKENLLLRVFDANDNNADEIIGVVSLHLWEMKDSSGQPQTFSLRSPIEVNETSTSNHSSLGSITIRMTIKANERATFNVVHTPVTRSTSGDEDPDDLVNKENTVNKLLKLTQSSEPVACALKDCKLLTGKHLSTFNLYSKNVIHDILDDARCLLASDIEYSCDRHDFQCDVDNYFSRSTRIDLLSGKYCHISPVYVDSGKYVFELETNDKVYVLRTLSVYAMWSWIRVIREAFTYWTRQNKGDESTKPTWLSDHWRAYVEIENAHERVLVGMGLLDLNTPFLLSLELHENILDKAGKVLNIVNLGGQLPDDVQKVPLDGLCGIIVSSDYNVPGKYRLQVEIELSKKRRVSAKFLEGNSVDNNHSPVKTIRDRFKEAARKHADTMKGGFKKVVEKSAALATGMPSDKYLSFVAKAPFYAPHESDKVMDNHATNQNSNYHLQAHRHSYSFHVDENDLVQGAFHTKSSGAGLSIVISETSVIGESKITGETQVPFYKLFGDKNNSVKDDSCGFDDESTFNDLPELDKPYTIDLIADRSVMLQIKIMKGKT